MVGVKDSLDKYISVKFGRSFRKLRVYEIWPYGESFCDGWEIQPKNDTGYRIRVLIDNGYPYTPLRLAVYPNKFYCKVPHVEKNGLLCLPRSDKKNSEGELDDALQWAQELIETPPDNDEFLKEFHSYLPRSKLYNRHKKIKLLEDQPAASKGFKLFDVFNPESRLLEFSLVTDNEESGQVWLQNYLGRTIETRSNSCVIRFHGDPVLPIEIPDNNEQLIRFISGKKGLAERVSKQLQSERPEKLLIIYSFDAPTGIAQFAVSIVLRKRPEKQLKGFRPGNMPQHLVLQRMILSTQQVYISSVQRVDPMWVLSRDTRPKINDVKNKTVAIIGCGSIGSEICKNLAQIGVSRFILVDPDTLEWENTGRYLFGAVPTPASFTKKVDVIDCLLRKQYPHIQEVDKYFNKVELLCESAICNLFEKADLIISLTGDASAESFIIEKARSLLADAPIVFGWAEAHAAAGQVVALFPEKYAYEELFESNGGFRLRVSDYADIDQQKPVPACGGLFQPHDAIELSPIISMIALCCRDIMYGEIASNITRSWVGNKQTVVRQGGKIQPNYTGVNNYCVVEHDSIVRNSED